MKSKMLILYLICLFLLVFGLTGCSEMAQIEDRDFVLAIGVGYQDSGFQVNFAKPDLPSLTGQSAKENTGNIVEYSSESMPKIEEEYARNSQKRLDFSHLQVIILDKSLVSNKEKMNEFLKYIENNYEIARNTLVFYTDEQVSDLLKLDKNVGGNIGDYLKKLYENNPYNKDTQKTTIGEMVNCIYQTDKVLLIPKLEIQKDSIWVNGAGIFKENTFVEYISENQLTYRNFMLGIGKGRNIVLDNSEIIRITELKNNYKYVLADGMPYIIININGTGECVKENINPTTDQNRVKILNSYVKKVLLFQCQEFIMNKKIDYLNLYRNLPIRNPMMWEKYQGNPSQFLQDVSMKIEVDIQLK